MKLAIQVATILIALGGTQAAIALDMPSSERDENRQILIGLEGTSFNPAAPTRVYTGPPHELSEVEVTAAQAIEMHLDQLEEHGISLEDLYGQTAATSEPAWPLVGYFQFHEKGWYQMGAHCPEVSPEEETTLEEMYDTILPGADDHLGTITTSISEDAINERGLMVQSALQYWSVDQDHTTAPPQATWWYEGWTIQAGYWVDYFCREPTSGTGLVFHDSFVTPYADRVDE